jgi:hypothetical protein
MTRDTGSQTFPIEVSSACCRVSACAVILCVILNGIDNVVVFQRSSASDHRHNDLAGL